MTTMRDVARRAGVSAKTVSRVFNDDPHVTEETRQRVRRALDELGYVPNRLAQAFRGGRHKALAVAVPDIADPFFASVVKAIEAVAGDQGLGVLITSTGYAPDRERRRVESLLNERLVGLVTTPVANDQSYLSPWLASTPIVFIDRRPGEVVADYFVEDDDGGAQLATNHLLRHGHRRIAFIGDDPAVATARLRRDGYAAALAAAGIAVDAELVKLGDWSTGHVSEALAHMLALDSPPTAVFAANARSGIGTALALRELERDDLAVVAFGDAPLAAALRPGLTVIDQNPSELGRQAVLRVLARIESPGAIPPQGTVLPVRLVERGSGEIPGPALGGV
ncbi:MAG TPA: LacI family DNA-binding transcriptional regulator [Actinomycetaceae bacterium]|nr:LacI family DNA-binding transcriptional regulator [Actinomycetaceae bacterium]